MQHNYGAAQENKINKHTCNVSLHVNSCSLKGGCKHNPYLEQLALHVNCFSDRLQSVVQTTSGLTRAHQTACNPRGNQYITAD